MQVRQRATPLQDKGLRTNSLAGTHDGGYKAILRSHITSGYKDKLVLLETYDEDASRFSELGLDIFAIENLFTPEKVVKPEPWSVSG